MRKLLALAPIALLGGCAIIVVPDSNDVHVRHVFSKDAVEGNGMAARDERRVSSLPALDVSGALAVDVRVGPAASLVVEADSNLLPLIVTETRGNTLHISHKEQLRSKTPIRITYTVPRLSEVRASGSGRVHVRDLNGSPLDVRDSGSGEVRLEGKVESLNASTSGSGVIDAQALKSASADLTVSGSGRLSVGEVRGDYARMSVSGSGRLEASGAVRSLHARVTGSGSIDLASLTAQEADLLSSGSGGISATVKQSLNANSTGSGGIRVYGHPARHNIAGQRVHLLD